MSFQDIGRKGSSAAPSTYRSQGSQFNNINSSSSSSPSAKYKNGGVSGMSNMSGFGNTSGGATIGQPITFNDGENNEYSAISQAILHYQQNVFILSNITESIGRGSSNDSNVLKQQYDLQTNVLQELSSKILLQLEQLDKQKLSQRHNHNPQQHRATYLKLTRDYRWVETKYKNVQLDAKRKWSTLQMEQNRILEEEQRRHLEVHLDHDNSQMQMELHEDRIVEEIMREREEEVRNINKGMHQVNEIYKDLANIVTFQQEQVDEVEVTMEQANKNAESGLKQIEKAHAKANENTCIIS